MFRASFLERVCRTNERAFDGNDYNDCDRDVIADIVDWFEFELELECVRACMCLFD